jgi:Zn-dependent M28 family amino/carboxypeptidase
MDHIGKKGDYIFNGADDNGSGSTAVLELAEAIATGAIKPKRSILLALWTAEENGILGSQYYISHPVIPLQKTVAYINLDMIGRNWDEQSFQREKRFWGMNLPEQMEKRIELDNFISVSYAEDSKQAFTALKTGNPYVGFHLYMKKTRPVFANSDCVPFAAKKVPWIGFMACMHQDCHKPSDTYDKINFDFMVKVTRLAYLTALNLANE